MSSFHLGKQALQRVTASTLTEQPGKWLPSVLMGLYYITLWQPPLLGIPNLTWYIVLGIAVLIYLTQRSALDFHAASVFWVIYGLSFLGAVFSLLRAPYPDQALWNTVGFGVSFISSLLLLPVLATKLARRVILVALISAAFLWVYEIQRLINTHEVLAYSTFAETGENKNYIGFCLALSGVALFYLAALWRPARDLARWQVFAVRSIFGIGSIYLLYNMSLIYTRGGLVSAGMGILSVLIVMVLKNPSKSQFFSVGIIALMVIFSANFLLPRVLAASPAWEIMYLDLQNKGLDAYSHRFFLMEKGIYLISQNPFLGVGLGGSRHSLIGDNVFFPTTLIHNTYLADWAEKGLLGLLSNILWIVMYLKFIRRKFFDLPVFDQVWLILFIPLFSEMIFKDLGTASATMLLIFSSIYYEQYHLEKEKMKLFLEKKIGR